MTLRCIAGIERPDAGRVVVNGRVLYDSSVRLNLPPQKRRVGYLFQNYALFPHMTVAENIVCGMHGEKNGREQDDQGAACTVSFGGAWRAVSGAAFRRTAAACGACAYAGKRAGRDLA